MSGQPLKTVLYLGLEAPKEREGRQVWHMPVIQIVPRPSSDSKIVDFYVDLRRYTHAIFTSKSAVRLFFQHLVFFGYGVADLARMQMVVVGKATAAELSKHGGRVAFIATEETAEGVCRVIDAEISAQSYCCWGRSALARTVITDFLMARGCAYQDCIFYDTHCVYPADIAPLDAVDEIVFSSPSTVEGFCRVYGAIPWDKKLTTLGPVTEKQLFLLRE